MVALWLGYSLSQEVRFDSPFSDADTRKLTQANMDTGSQKTGNIPGILEYINFYLPIVDNCALILQISTPLQCNKDDDLFEARGKPDTAEA